MEQFFINSESKKPSEILAGIDSIDRFGETPPILSPSALEHYSLQIFLRFSEFPVCDGIRIGIAFLILISDCLFLA